jgi:hypothetical protein
MDAIPGGDAAMELLVYTVAQPVLNLAFGFGWGLVVQGMPTRRNALGLWALLAVFVSVRMVGDWLFNQPHLPWEWARLYGYATCFFAGIMLARFLRHITTPVL